MRRLLRQFAIARVLLRRNDKKKNCQNEAEKVCGIDCGDCFASSPSLVSSCVGMTKKRMTKRGGKGLRRFLLRRNDKTGKNDKTGWNADETDETDFHGFLLGSYSWLRLTTILFHSFVIPTKEDTSDSELAKQSSLMIIMMKEKTK